MATWLVEPANSIEVMLSSLTSIKTTSARNIKKYAALSSNIPKIVLEEPLPFSLQVGALLNDSSTFENDKRKLSYMDRCGDDILLILGSEQEAVLGGVELTELPRDVERSLVMPITVNFVGKGTVLGHMREAENATLGTGAATASDANASEGSCVQLNAQNEEVYFNITQSLWEMPLGDYRIYARVKDSAQVANDVYLQIYNNTDTASVLATAKTVTSSYAWYSGDFTLDSGESGDSLKVGVYKGTATANTISVDIIAAVMV